MNITKEKPLPVTANRKGAEIKADDLTFQNKLSVLYRQEESTSNSSASAQRQRILAWLQSGPLTTLEARQHLDILHPAARVMELRRQGHDIVSFWCEDLSSAGINHRVAQYVLRPDKQMKLF